MGLKVIAVKEGPGVQGAKQSRRQMAKDLAGKVLQDGDVVLTFRPELMDSMPYPHIQMGITHAGLVYLEPTSGVPQVAAFNIDSPMDSVYMGQFDSDHYAGDGANDAGTDEIHIVRPRGFSDERKRRLNNWIITLKKNLGRINGNRAQVKFQGDYMAPTFFANKKTTRQTVTTLGKIILELDTRTQQPMYCSEFAWHMLALSGCSFDEIKNAGPEGASCVAPVFDPMVMVSTKSGQFGLGEGPLADLLAAKLGAPALPTIFCSNGYDCKNNGKLSRGHRDVAALVAPLMGGLEQLYGARAIQGAPAEAIAEPAGQLNGAVPPNYSPTAFFIQSLTGQGPMEYIATIAFVEDARLFSKIQQQAGCGGNSANAGGDALPPRVPSGAATDECVKEYEAVRSAQQDLISSKHLPEGSADGRWGPRSQAALNKYQRDASLALTQCLTQSARESLSSRRQ